MRKTLTWTLDGANRPYVSAVLSEQDPGQSFAATSKTEQTIDVWGNVTQTKLYNFGNLTTPAKTYTNAYLTDTNYTSRGIRNRLVSSVLTDGTKTLTLVSNTYDVYSLRPECATSGPGFSTGLYSHPDTPRQWVDPGTTYRGNLTRSVVPGGWGCTAYYQTGMVHGTSTSTGAQSSVSLVTGTNYTVPESITAAGLASTFNWDTALQEKGLTGPHSETVSLSYDGYHRVTSVVDASGTQGASYTAYDSGTGAKAVVTETWGTVVTKKTVDGFGRVVKLEKGDTNGITSVVDTEYEACACTPFGKVRRVSQPHAPGAGAVWTTYSFDGLGRTTQVLAADGASTTAYLYQGNTVKVTDPAGKWKKMTLDAFGRIVQVNEPNPAGGADYVTSYSYDFVDHLVRAELPRPTGGGSYTQVRTWTYSDTDLRLQSQTQPETGSSSFAYNSLGLLFSKSDAKGIRKELTYDDKQRVTAVRYYNTSDGSESTNRRVDSYYDTNPFDGTYTQNRAGRLTAISYKVKRHTGNATFTWLAANEQYSYSADGRLLKKKLVVNGVALEAQLGYDSSARLNSITYPGTAGTYTYEYDSQSRLSKLKQGSTELVSTVQYGVAGELLQMDGETRQYNTLGQLTRITSRPYACVPGFFCPPPDTDFEYRYSATANNGQITQMKNWKSGEEVTYAYDSLSRLASATTTGPEWGLSWSWDGWGNRTAQSVTKGSAPTITLSYNAATNRINSSGYTYDGAGNLTLMPKGAGTLPMAYDPDNRLILAGTESPFMGDTGERYSYAPDNKRVYRKVIGTQERVAFWLGGQLLAEFTPNSGWTSVTLAVAYKYFGSRRVGEKNDRLGSVVSATKSYYPFGEEKVVTVDGSYKFATYWRDSATGLDYADQRYYSAGISRFLTADPDQAYSGVIAPAIWNRYGYVIGNPVNYIDPLGLECTWNPSTNTLTCPMPTSPLGGGSGGGFPPRSVGTDASDDPIIRRQFFIGVRESLAYSVDHLGLPDCVALKGFAQAALDMAEGHSVDLFVDAFQYLTPRDSMRGLQGMASATGVKSSGGVTDLNRTGKASGFAEQYQDSDNHNADQVHHFAFYFQVGYHLGAVEGGLLGTYVESGLLPWWLGGIESVNAGDRRLAAAAAAIGYQLKQNRNPSYVIQAIQDLICGK